MAPSPSPRLHYTASGYTSDSQPGKLSFMALLYKNQDISGDLKVLDWNDHGLEFVIGKDGIRKRHHDRTPNLFVGHWTAGEGSHKSCFSTLRKRHLSVHLFIDSDGVIYQFADLDLAAFHAGIVNERAIGVEIQNRGVPPTHEKTPRAIYEAKVQGAQRQLLEFYPAQVTAFCALAERFAEVGFFPRKIPRDPLGSILAHQDVSVANYFTGVCEHLHVSSHKIDSGLQLVKALHGQDWQ